MGNNNIISTIDCPKCKSQNVTAIKSIINKRTGLKTGISSLFWGLLMFVSGWFLAILAYINRDDVSNPPYVVFGFGFILVTSGLPMITTFIFRKKANYYHYQCKSCSYKWNRLGGEAISPFIYALEKNDLEIKRKALNVIVNIQDSRFIEPLKKNFNDSDSEIRISAFNALCAYKNEGFSLNEIFDATQDNELKIRIKAIETLGKYKGREINDPDTFLKQLICLLEDKSADVRDAAMNSLRETTGKKFYTVSQWKSWWEDRLSKKA